MTWRLTSGHAFPRRQTVQQACRVVQRLWTGAWCGGGLRGREAGPLPGGFGHGPGFGESPGQRRRRREGRGGGHLGYLARGADGGVALWVTKAVRRGGAGRSGGQADGRWLTSGLVTHGSCLAVGSFRGGRSQFLCCKDTKKPTGSCCYIIRGFP